MIDAAVVAEARGVRLDRFLCERFPGHSRSYFQDLIARGCVSVDGAPRPAQYRLAGGELVRVRAPVAAWEEFPFESWVAYEDEDLLALRKPPGLVVHPAGESWLKRPEAALSEREPNLAGLLLKHRPASGASGLERLGIVHRLDRQTSGIWLAAKTPGAQRALAAAFRERTVEKTYRAVVLGALTRTLVEAPIGRARRGRRRVQVTPWGRAASTEFRAAAAARGVSLVEARPKTGRTHQIRAHLALLKHPVLGDPEWFGEPERAALRALGHPEPPRMLLHAYRLRFAHPRTGEPMNLAAPLPKDLRDYWNAVRAG